MGGTSTGGTSASESARGVSIVEKYEALVAVSEALGAHRERDELFRALEHQLRHVVDFDLLGLGIYVEATHRIELFVLACMGQPVPPPTLPVEASMTYWVVQHQEPVVIDNLETDTQFPQAAVYFLSQGMRSTCALPLTTPHRRLGLMLAASRSPNAYARDGLPFLRLVANQVALAVDDALNYGALQQALVVERERQGNIDTSDRLLRALSAALDIRIVFPRISEIAAMVLPHDLLTLTFHNGDGEVLVHATSREWQPLPTSLKVQHFIPEGDGVAVIGDFRIDPAPAIEPADFWDRIQAAGYRSFMAIHLNARDQSLGLQFWSKQAHAFDDSLAALGRRIADHVALAVSHEQLAEMERLAAEEKLRADRLQARVKSLSDELVVRTGRMVGRSAEWQAVLKAATQVAATETTVLIVGESGTGKEVIARFIHHASPRADGPFVALNCAALPEQLLESELFGYERGAFTGAQQPKPGQIELAAGGVLFLDEVAEMSPSAQAKLLRVLQEREFHRLGSTRTLKANVRVVAATNRDLEKAIERGDFREDLFYRLQVFDIRLPPLRERQGDLLPLSETFLQEIGQLFGRPPAGLTRDAKNALLNYHWPGNVRQLRNALERAAILCEGGLITAEHLSLGPARPLSAPTPAAAATSDLSAVERGMIVQALAACRGNKSKAAAKLGISRTQLYVRLRKHQLS